MASRPASRILSRTASSSLPGLRTCTPRSFIRCLSSQQAKVPTIVSLSNRRPVLRRHHQPAVQSRLGVPSNKRTIFIQTLTTPNADALKFKPNTQVLPEDFPVSSVEYLTPRSTLQAPHPSPLAAKLLNVDGVKSVFYGPDFITITKAADANWAHIKPEVFSLITEAITIGEPIVSIVEAKAGEGRNASQNEDNVKYNEEDQEIVEMIQELLETRIRPAIQEDGGDIDFRGYENGNVLLKLRGACRTCDSSTVTLKNGIESMLKHYLLTPGPLGISAMQIEEVQTVTQVLDEEEEVALKEFALFEEKLRQQKGPQATASTVGKGSLDTVQ
ncbi:hypothetical protein FQN57_005376 [Myotisia sp. PD_48]|nr:hypothetical protein FQN57_005376 [Myotisia sp. PD_48]